MYLDVVDLRDFYGGQLGLLARRMIRTRIRGLWPDLRGRSLLGLGYAPPYLAPFLGEAERVLALMPAQQGVLHWPVEGPGLAALVHDDALPLEDASVDRILMVHALELSEHRRDMLVEAWRVLAGNGRLLAVVPNRRGLWARFDHTPFGHGQPFTASQLSRLLREHDFAPVRTARALFPPPYASGLVMRSAPAAEQIGARWFTTFSGVVMIEAQKQIYAKPKPTGHRVLARAKAFLPRPSPAPVPSPLEIHKGNRT